MSDIVHLIFNEGTGMFIEKSSKPNVRRILQLSAISLSPTETDNNIV